MGKFLKHACLRAFLSTITTFVVLFAYPKPDTVYFEVGLEKAAKNAFEVQMTLTVKDAAPVIDLCMPVWTPGYYQVLDFGKNVNNFQVKDERGNALAWQKIGDSKWRIATDQASALVVHYTVNTERPFVAIPYIDEERAFIRPTGIFLYEENSIDRPAVVSVTLANGWRRIATGLDSIAPQVFLAKDFDILYDSPILVGELDELPSFLVGGKPHRFLGYNLAAFDRVTFMYDLERIVRAASDVIGDIPYDHYAFIGIGSGNGGIEQLNSTAIAFTGEGLDNPSSRMRTLCFIAHEYFHHYNVKRIRPIELGPFDYSRPNRTHGLWFSEGLTVYYEGVILGRAGLMTGGQVLEKWERIIQGYENNAGRKKQTLAESSRYTWEDGPFGRRGETISFYEKGPIIGMLLDMTIRSATDNQKSLDDVMRALYYGHYKEKQRGFTEQEIQDFCEGIAGKDLNAVFSYIYTTEEIDYQKYFGLVGIDFDRVYKEDGTAQVTLKPSLTTSTVQKDILDSMLGSF